MDGWQPPSISPRELFGAIGIGAAPLIVDLRRGKHAALDALALIVRGADTARLERTPQSSGLLASLGLAAKFTDDHATRERGW